jgi:hypothetical protein
MVALMSESECVYGVYTYRLVQVVDCDSGGGRGQGGERREGHPNLNHLRTELRVTVVESGGQGVQHGPREREWNTTPTQTIRDVGRDIRVQQSIGYVGRTIRIGVFCPYCRQQL